MRYNQSLNEARMKRILEKYEEEPLKEVYILMYENTESGESKILGVYNSEKKADLAQMAAENKGLYDPEKDTYWIETCEIQ